jgi:hypothetical protein
VDEGKISLRRGSVRFEERPEGRVYVWVNEDSSENKPVLDGETSALISAKDESAALIVK